MWREDFLPHSQFDLRSDETGSFNIYALCIEVLGLINREKSISFRDENVLDVPSTGVVSLALPFILRNVRSY
jgi:hypothetical protein